MNCLHYFDPPFCTQQLKDGAALVAAAEQIIAETKVRKQRGTSFWHTYLSAQLPHLILIYTLSLSVLLTSLQAKLELAKNTRTDRDSTVEEVWAKNPKIKEEVLQEIEDHAWFKDVK